MTESEYTPREDYANVRPLGQFGEPNPENYLGKKSIAESKSEHPSNGKKAKKEKHQLEPEEAVNLFRLSMLFLGIITTGIGIGLWLTPALGILVFGAMLWITSVWMINLDSKTSSTEE